MGFYYLQSRYYNPALGRFLNADALISTGQGELGNNMFAYCRNNPVHRVDVSGTEDAVCYDEDGKPLSSEDIEKDAGAGVPETQMRTITETLLTEGTATEMVGDFPDKARLQEIPRLHLSTLANKENTSLATITTNRRSLLGPKAKQAWSKHRKHG